MARPARPWFAAKAYGYGASLPIRWEGWLATAAFVAGMVAAGAQLDGYRRVIAMGACVVLFGIVAIAKTEGGWRWRWGGKR